MSRLITTFLVVEQPANYQNLQRLKIFIQSRHVQHLQDAFAETKDKDQFRTERQADKARETYDELMERGYTHLYPGDFSDTLDVTINYLEFASGQRADGLRDWCEPRFSIESTRVECLHESYKVLKHVARRVAKVRDREFNPSFLRLNFDDPYRLLDVLRSIKSFQEVESVEIPGGGIHICNRVQPAPDQQERAQARRSA
jgi:hypothetical protein